MLVVLLWVLGFAAVALLVLLFWLLRPTSTTAPGQAAGYPIEVVTTIYGFGEDANELLKTPIGVAFDPAGNVWISNTGQSRMEEYTSDGSFIRMVGNDEGPGKLSSPYGITVDPATDRVYVADFALGTVQVYSTDGNYVGHFPADDQSLKVFGPAGFTPYDVKVVDGRIVVSSYDGLYFFDQSGHVVSRWGGTLKGKNAYGAPLGMFNFPDAFVADPETGRIYVADTMNRRILALGSEGKWLWASGVPDANNKIKGFWQLPRGIEIGPDGNLYVVDTFRYDLKGMGTGHIVVLSPDGKLLSEFGRSGEEDGAFAFPDHLATGTGDLWAIADRENNRVVIFRLHTPYPTVTDVVRERYPKGLVQLQDAYITSSPTPAPSG
jgi:DNA-binding beta-propeller fold protein YncE